MVSRPSKSISLKAFWSLLGSGLFIPLSLSYRSYAVSFFLGPDPFNSPVSLAYTSIFTLETSFCELFFSLSYTALRFCWRKVAIGVLLMDCFKFEEGCFDKTDFTCEATGVNFREAEVMERRRVRKRRR